MNELATKYPASETTVSSQGDAKPFSVAVCRFCRVRLEHTFVNLGMSPLCENFLTREHLREMERFYPLHVLVCEKCLLVQLQEYVNPEEIFTEYAYFSSYSDSWLKHASDYTDMIVARLGLDDRSHVVEIASNDGYLLQYFVNKGISVLGIEPAVNVARAAVQKGVPTLVKFFDRHLAQQLVTEGDRADLIIANNTLAQVPNINDFVQGMKVLLQPEGVLTLEFPHLMCLIQGNQFDTIYHEHFSYFSFIAVEQIFRAHGLILFDVEELWTHGGSLRIYARHQADESKPRSQRVEELRAREIAAGLDTLAGYAFFAEKVETTKRNLLDLLIHAKREGKSIAGYGAPGKGNTLLNYCGIRTDFLDYTVDRNPYKHGKFLPGTHIPIFPVDKIRETRPNYVLILPWNLKDEIMEQMSYVREWGGRFIVPIPKAEVL
jgi:hypothetical protein